MAEDLSERFWSKCVPEPNSGCWLWTHSTFKTGYGKFTLRRKATRYAHRLAYELYYGVAPGASFVCHRCDTRLCVNPDHLFLGSATENNRDMAAKGRNNQPRGTAHFRARLTVRDVHIIRTLRAWGASAKALARIYPIGMNGITDITLRRSWRHV